MVLSNEVARWVPTGRQHAATASGTREIAEISQGWERTCCPLTSS